MRSPLDDVLYLEAFNFSKEGLSVLGMCYESDWGKKVERENTHYGLSVYGISALNKVNIKVCEYNLVDKGLDLLNVGKLYFDF